MNKPQRIAALIGFCLVGLMLSVPPWKYVQHLTISLTVERDAGYAPVFTPPTVKDHEAVREAFSIPKTKTLPNVSIANANVTTGTYAPRPTPAVVESDIDEDRFEVRLDASRLLTQCAVVFFVTLGFVAFLHRSSKQ